MIKELLDSNRNICICGHVGCGKTVQMKQFISKDVSNGIKVLIVDSFGEYEKLLKAYNSAYLTNIDNEKINNILTGVKLSIDKKSERNILNQLISISETAVKNKVKRIYIDSEDSRIFMKNVLAFEKFRNKLNYIVATQNINTDKCNLRVLDRFFIYYVLDYYDNGFKYKQFTSAEYIKNLY